MDSIEKVVKEVGVESGIVARMVSTAEAGVVLTQEEAESAATQLSGVKAYLKGIEAKYKSWTEGLNQSLKRIRDDYNPVKAAAEKAEKIWKGKLTDFHTEQERQIAIQEAKAREAAEKDRVKLEGQAQRLAEKGKHDQAAAKQQEAEAMPTPVFAPPPKIAGTYFKEEWRYETTNEALIPKQYWVVDHQALAKVVKAMNGTREIPGIRQYPKKIPVSK